METAYNILLAIVTPAAVSGFTALITFIFLLPTKIGERLVGHHFEAKLEAIKNDHKKEMGILQAELDHLKDRGVRSNEAEYQAITAAWESFVDAYQATRGSIGQFLSFPDLSKLGDEDVRAFLEGDGITGGQADYVISGADRNRAYSRTVRARSINAASIEIWKARGVFDKQCVFIPDALAKQFNTAVIWLNEVRVEQYMMSRDGHLDIGMERTIALMGPEGTKMFEGMRDSVRARLLRASESAADRRVAHAPEN